MKTTIISLQTKHVGNDNNQPQMMTSLEIAELTGKPHNDILKAIRKMEPAWEKVCQGKFSLTSRTIVQPNGGTREVPCYQLTKTECLYIAFPKSTPINVNKKKNLIPRVISDESR